MIYIFDNNINLNYIFPLKIQKNKILALYNTLFYYYNLQVINIYFNYVVCELEIFSMHSVPHTYCKAVLVFDSS